MKLDEGQDRPFGGWRTGLHVDESRLSLALVKLTL